MDTVKKFGAGANKTTGAGKDAAKLDRETEELHHERYDLKWPRYKVGLKLPGPIRQLLMTISAGLSCLAPDRYLSL